ncbi:MULTISPECIES: histidine phosphatase family protein [unclassified Prosthecochloris]|uniref:SixA phosphatase family protein n=1 Tax=unclassified Prosthecochloris TaxID=2632826 RepID=UPI00223E8877|nr:MULTISPECIES: histidine phosphatase family protein [unclassified Prosthecochloris]UZJ39364.1 histidine phosphatase family protein [Prosthecochloris sp. SCSIO W1102]
MKTLYLVRHAKSSWDNANLADFDRPLNKRGQKAAPFMAKLMSENNVQVDRIISSPANRALTTAETFCEVLGYPPEKIEQRIEIYEGGINQMLQIVREIPDSCSSAMLFGHNPTMTSFANFISGEHLENIVTCGVVRIDLKTDFWQQTLMDSGKLVWYEYPKKYQ